MIRSVLSTLTVLLLCAPMAKAFGADNRYMPPVTVKKLELVYELNGDGTYSTDELETFRVNNDDGIRQHAQVALPYSSSLQSLEVIEAYTTNDGIQHDVPKNKIVDQQSSISAGAPSFDDRKLRVILYPDVRIGSELTFHFRQTQNVPLFSNSISIKAIFRKVDEYKDASIKLIAPSSMHLNIEALELHGGEVRSDIQGKKVWQWKLLNTTAEPGEAGGIDISDVSPRLSISTFSNYQEVSDAYLVRARQHSTVTPSISKLADDITSGISDRRTQAEALYNWVSKNIRYVAVYLGFGSVVPHSASEIAEIRYGDCKDHVALLEALLSAKKIKSSPVLINSSNSYWLPEIAMIPGNFDHVITYIPEFDIFVDSTIGTARFGMLAPNEYGKSVLVASDDKNIAGIRMLPTPQASDNETAVNTRLVVQSDGTVVGVSHTKVSGIHELVARSTFLSLPSEMSDQVGTQILASTGLVGNGRYMQDVSGNLSGKFSYTAEFTLPNYVPASSPAAFVVPKALPSFNGVELFVDEIPQQSPKLPRLIVNGSRSESITIDFPDKTEISALPKNVALNGKFWRYESTYTKDKNKVVINRTLVVGSPSSLVTPDEYAELRALSAKVSQDIRSQILYQ